MSKQTDLASSRLRAEQVLSGLKDKEKEKAPERLALDKLREADAAKTARLREARLAKEAEERNAVPPPAPARAARRKAPH